MKSKNIREKDIGTKLSRRDFVKVAGTGAMLVAMPNLAISKINQISFEPAKIDVGGKEPLVILVENDKLRGFRGFEETILKDLGLAGDLSGRIEEENNEDATIILANDDRVIKFKGLSQNIIGDRELSRSLSSKFAVGG